MRDEAASGKDRSTPIPNIPPRFEIVVTARLPAGNARAAAGTPSVAGDGTETLGA